MSHGQEPQEPLLPFVSIVVPTRNEADFIRRCLDSILNQRYPPDMYEVILVDGMSVDGTVDIIDDVIRQNPDRTIKRLDNPRTITPTGRNIGITEAKGDLVSIVDAHSELATDFIDQSVRALRKSLAECVGGAIENLGDGLIGKAISLAQNSPFGMGPARFRHATEEQYTDTAPFPTYRREVFDQIGLFDEELKRNQDDEFNYRLRKGGGKVFFSPTIRFSYFGRSSLLKLWQQLFWSGYWKVRVAQKHRRPTTLRQLAPPGFVTSLVLGGILTPLNPAVGLGILISVLALYSLLSWAFAFRAAKEHGWRFLLPLPLIFLVMHLSYGLGYLWGIFNFLVLHMFPKRRDDLVG
ncbi:MAG: glycosyltransferase family 2 protein [Chloroflexi bacterium]|nr:glycosyltransferase family 2 protein [Chloroflexota bacterium]